MKLSRITAVSLLALLTTTGSLVAGCSPKTDNGVPTAGKSTLPPAEQQQRLNEERQRPVDPVGPPPVTAVPK